MISLVVRSVGHSYGSRRIFRDVNLELAAGDVLAITGANGSGKSTLLKILAGILQPTNGDVEFIFFQHNIPRELHPLHVGLVAPYVNLYEDLTLRENFEFIMQARSVHSNSVQIGKVTSKVGLSVNSNKPLRTYSTGMQQRARFAAALFHEPNILLLDEPTLGLDRLGRDMVNTVVSNAQKSGLIVVIASNAEREISVAKQILCIEDYVTKFQKFA